MPEQKPAVGDRFVRRKIGRPRGSKKELVTLRLDQDLVALLRAGGAGWQTRVNDTLRAVTAKAHADAAAVMTIAETPWDIVAEDLRRETGRPLDQCRDLVILSWMRRGDIRPLADWLVAGHKPGKRVLWELGIMLHDDEEAAGQPGYLMNDPKFRYRLERKARRGKEGRPSNPGNDIRDILIAGHVAAHMKAGMSYNDSVARAMSDLRATGYDDVSTQTIRDAYDAYQGKK